MAPRNARSVLAAVLVVLLTAGLVTVVRESDRGDKTTVIGYFENSNGIFAGDEVRILGLPVGKIEKIEPHPRHVKITFWYDRRYKVPADAKAVILSPSLVTSRAIQLTPAYTGGPTMKNDAVIPQERTAVPVEWDDVRAQLEKLVQTLRPTQPGGVAPLGSFINTAADNLRGEGANIRDTVIELSQALSVLGDHSTDIFSTVKNLATVVAALQNSSGVMRQLNRNLAYVTGLLANDPIKVGAAVQDLNTAVGDVQGFVAENRDALGVTSDKLASLSTAVTDSLDDIKQTLHVAPNALQNLVNIWRPTQGALSGALMVNNFANTISFLCGAVQAASRLNAEQSAKLCVQYLAPIMKNRQYNFPPLGENLFVGTRARPNEVTYSEDWMRPDFVPPAPNASPAGAAPQDQLPAANPTPPRPAEAVTTNPSAGLSGMMVPPGGR
ncbi:ABC-type transporter Mla maintaining outer membrane lipid asymmetry, periplasmic component MlaD [Mycobacterium rhizamassiliense]|uniref:ABC-type transporter Mla maintaining outer membrane lipid asymmetry, periplasmic component MlaD n=1 Tax=Mycobacterium rhizamassiliense TaxID=1841860 RepID=A0A2U3NTQ8_9MYCO|nr:MCE family protein [Mycobacterium rhizamassiliense]SPM34911.1 ABC-type transporter Mla maintaining outer membrane lipid asymmetry, periplasmic component MlaD [Mycobacterium rhizamassiliense]